MGPVGEKTLRSGSDDTAMGDVTLVTPPRDTCRTAAAMQRTNWGVSQLWVFNSMRINSKREEESDWPECLQSLVLRQISCWQLHVPSVAPWHVPGYLCLLLVCLVRARMIRQQHEGRLEGDFRAEAV